jgi:hypothetical protein
MRRKKKLVGTTRASQRIRPEKQTHLTVRDFLHVIVCKLSRRAAHSNLAAYNDSNAEQEQEEKNPE